MMEALAIGLAVYGGVVTFYAVRWFQFAKDWRGIAEDLEKLADAWRAKHREARAQIAAFDGDGNGKIGGSKPRGKG